MQQLAFKIWTLTYDSEPKISFDYKMIDEDVRYREGDDTRFRKETNFWLMNIRWANTIEITNDEANFFLKKQEEQDKFNFDDFKNIGSIERLSAFICKEALISDEIKLNVRKTGVNIDPAKLPDLNNPEVFKSHPNLIV